MSSRSTTSRGSSATSSSSSSSSSSMSRFNTSSNDSTWTTSYARLSKTQPLGLRFMSYAAGRPRNATGMIKKSRETSDERSLRSSDSFLSFMEPDSETRMYWVMDTDPAPRRVGRVGREGPPGRPAFRPHPAGAPFVRPGPPPGGNPLGGAFAVPPGPRPGPSPGPGPGLGPGPGGPHVMPAGVGPGGPMPPAGRMPPHMTGFTRPPGGVPGVPFGGAGPTRPGVARPAI